MHSADAISRPQSAAAIFELIRARGDDRRHRRRKRDFHFHKTRCNSSRLGVRLRPAEGMRSTMEDDFELQWSELANILGQTGLDILASLVPGACAATLAHSSRTWTIDCLTRFRRVIYVRSIP